MRARSVGTANTYSVVERSDLGLWKQHARVAVRTLYTYTMIAWDSASLKDPPSSEIAGTVPSGEAWSGCWLEARSSVSSGVVYKSL